jgi:hypothetical protein
MSPRFQRLFAALSLTCVTAFATGASVDVPGEPYQPTMGQPGKDVVWIPSPETMVEKMLDLARVTAHDYVIDLGSGDGRNVIAAAKRGARALGVEYNADLVELSKRAAAKEGVADKAAFVRGDMFQADISQATALVLFLVPDNLHKLMPRFLEMRPGTRIVSNTYEIPGWEADETARINLCVAWCAAFLYIVPAKIGGTWRMPQGELTLEQSFQTLWGTYQSSGISVPVENGRLRGDEIRFTVNGVSYTGRVSGEKMEGTAAGRSAGRWSAVRAGD